MPRKLPKESIKLNMSLKKIDEGASRHKILKVPNFKIVTVMVHVELEGQTSEYKNSHQI